MRGHDVVVVGAGGNIGSHLVPHLGRMPSVRRVTLIDRDAYTSANLLAQDFQARDVGRSKAWVQARRLRRSNPTLDVTALEAAVEDLPPTRLRGDVILACLDSRCARQCVNETAWRLGVPWIDSGVAVVGDGSLLARVTVYVPGAQWPCLECAWDDRDYEQLEQTYACGANAPEPRPTGAPSALGALAASLQALECRRLLAGEPDLAGRQVLMDAARAAIVVTRFRRRADCRMWDHDAWAIERLPRETLGRTLADMMGLELNGQDARGAPVPGVGPPASSDTQAGAVSLDGGTAITVAGRRFERRFVCAGCRASRTHLRLVSARRAAPRCGHCGARMVARAFDIAERLEAATLTATERRRTLRSLGVRVGDLLRVSRADSERYLEIGDDPS
jgi:molybdopterin/thiamine biosynthesis adenylyltransferase